MREYPTEYDQENLDGCETCAIHWQEDGLKFDGADGATPVWKDCPDCGGNGILPMKNFDKIVNNDIQGQDYTDKAFSLDRIIDKGHGAAFYILLIVTCLGCYGLLWFVLAFPYVFG